MVAWKLRRGILVSVVSLTTVGSAAINMAFGGDGPTLLQRARGASTKAAPKAAPAQERPAETPRLVPTEIPVNPTDPIAIVNNEVITRRQLSDECVARKGQE